MSVRTAVQQSEIARRLWRALPYGVRVKASVAAGEPSAGSARSGASDQAIATAIWDLVWAGYLSNDTLAPLRTVLATGKTWTGPARTGLTSGQAPDLGPGDRAGGASQQRAHPSIPRAGR